MGDKSKIEARRARTGLDIAADRESKPDPVGVRCSFCSRDRGEVLAMFAGPGGIHICNECIALFAQEVAKRQEG